MTRASLLSASLLLGLTACNGTTAVGAGGSGTTGSTGTTSSGTTTVTGDTVTLTMDSFMVPAGGEVYYCQNFANPFGAKDVDVQEFESHMSAGSHHLLLFYEPNVTSDGALETCSGLEFAATPYGSQTPDDALTFPAGVAALVPGSNGLRIQSHYLNTTGSAITAHVEIVFHLAQPGSVQNEAGVLFVIDPKFKILPSSSALVTDDCTLPQDMNIIRANSHMHQHGTNFVATIAGNSVYQTTTWNEPKPTVFAPPVTAKAGDPLHFACSFTNNTAATITFGESAQTDEMCIFTASFYPTPAGQATIDASGCVQKQQ